MAKNKFEWKKEQINGRWVSVCQNAEHVPMVVHLKSGEYKVEAGKRSRIEKDFGDAIKYALEIYKKDTKFNKKFVA